MQITYSADKLPRIIQQPLPIKILKAPITMLLNVILAWSIGNKVRCTKYRQLSSYFFLLNVSKSFARNSSRHTAAASRSHSCCIVQWKEEWKVALVSLESFRTETNFLYRYIKTACNKFPFYLEKKLLWKLLALQIT